MTDTLVETLNTQLVSLDKELGAVTLAGDVINAIEATVMGFDGSGSSNELLPQVITLYNCLLECRPRMANVILEVQRMGLFLKDHPNADRAKLKDFIQTQREDRLALMLAVREQGYKIFSEKRKPLLHSWGKQLSEILGFAFHKGTNLEVTIADQENVKTRTLLKFLTDSKIPYSVISEYAVAHVATDLDSALFGCLSVDSKGRAVMAPGSNPLISQLCNAGVPCYLVLPTSKFSFWEDDAELAHREIRKKLRAEVEFEKRVFSHDIVPVGLFTAVISQNGILSPQEAVEELKRKQQKFFEDEKRLRG